MPNIVYIATSLDGYIADKHNGLDWLDYVPVPAGDDLGFTAFMAEIDALVMGRKTFETVLGFGGPWPYAKPVFVLSSRMITLPAELTGKVHVMNAAPETVVASLQAQGFQRLYIDGGQTIQKFLQADLIDELIISRIPILLGGGIPLFGNLPKALGFELISAEILLGQIVKQHYRRRRNGIDYISH